MEGVADAAAVSDLHSQICLDLGVVVNPSTLLLLPNEQVHMRHSVWKNTNDATN